MKRTVLLLSANEALADRVRGLLEEDGPYRLLVCADGEEARRLVAAEPVEMVLYDAELALSEGPAAAAHIRADHPFLPLIPVTRILREDTPTEGAYAPPDRGTSVDRPL